MSSKRDRLFKLLPSVYRRQDAEAGWPLRSLLQIIADQVNAVENDISQLYENWFIETCQDWVVPYIGDLVGYRLVHEAGEPQVTTGDPALQLNKVLIPRREVANTIRFRRRKGTLALLELLSNAAAEWPARAVEFYRLLGWTQSINHLRLTQGKTTDLRLGDALERLDGPFDEIAHTIDVRRINSHQTRGRYNINSVGLFVWRLKTYSVTKTPAYCREDVGHHCYTFSILGNDTPLYTLPEPEETPTHIARELNLPTPIRRRAFKEQSATQRKVRSHASSNYYGKNKSILIWAEGWKGTLGNEPIPKEAIIPADLSHWKYCPPPNHIAVDPVLGRLTFPPRQLPEKVYVSYRYAFSDDIGGGEYYRPLRQSSQNKIYHVGEGKEYALLNEALKQWQSDKPAHAIIEIAESSVFTEQIDISIGKNQRLEIRAANGKRPIIRLLDWHTDLPDDLTVAGIDGGSFALDGLLITGRGIQTRGSLDQLVIRHSTLVPTWSPPGHQKMQPTKASIDLSGACSRLDMERSIAGSIQIMHNEVQFEPVKITIVDSIIDSANPHRGAIGAPGYRLAHATLTILRSTVLGQIQAHAIQLAENCIFSGLVQVARRQIGCMRFCYVPPGSRTPRRYNCQPDLVEKETREEIDVQLRVKPQFNSLGYGTPTYCQLAEDCPPEIIRGADDRSEMGAFHDLYQPQRAVILRARLQEYSQAYIDANVNYGS